MRELVSRARDSGYRALVLTVDVPVAGARHRDTHNGLTVPPTLTPRTLLGMLGKPRWLFDALTTEPLAFESLGAADDVMGLIDRVFDAGVTFADVEWLRAEWTGSLVVKGVRRRRAGEARAAWRRGRVCRPPWFETATPSAPAATAATASSTRCTLGDRAEIYLDGGVRSGADVAAAVALGARAAFVGRPYLYALMAGGERGVDHLLALLRKDYIRTLRLLGVTETAGLTSDLIGVY